MIWPKGSARTALLNFQYEMYVLLEDDPGIQHQVLLILRVPSKKKCKKQKQTQLAAGSKERAAGHQVQHCGTGAWQESNQRGREIGDAFHVLIQHRMHGLVSGMLL